MVSLSIDYSLIVQLINFFLLIIALNFFLYKPIRKILAERNTLFDTLKSKAAQAKAILENSDAEKAKIAAESLRKGLDTKNEIKNKSQDEEKKILSEAQVAASKNLTDARAELRKSAEAARAALAEETRNIAKDIAGKILGRPL